MLEFLTFALAAPLAAMGEVAVGERRGSWDRPGRSAVLGLVAACLGLDRADEAAHASLETGYGLALRRECFGPLLADYHTAQVPPRQRGRRFATRAEELAVTDLETILSRRDYRADLLVLAALWPRLHPQPGEDARTMLPLPLAGEGRGEGQPRDRARWSLAEIAAALSAPHFVLYLGRKSCPLMLPLAPRRTEAADPLAALARRAVEGAAPERRLLRRRSGETPLVVMDADEARRFNLGVVRRELRRDGIASRRRWQFALREEAILAAAP